MKAYRGSGGIAPPLLNHSNKFSGQPYPLAALTTRSSARNLLRGRLGIPERVRGKSFVHTGIRSSNRPCYSIVSILITLFGYALKTWRRQNKISEDTPRNREQCIGAVCSTETLLRRPPEVTLLVYELESNSYLLGLSAPGVSRHNDSPPSGRYELHNCLLNFLILP